MQVSIPGSIQRLAQAFREKGNMRLKACVPLQHPACPDNIRVCRGPDAWLARQSADASSGALQFSCGDFLDGPLCKELKLGPVSPGEIARLGVEQA